MYCHTALDVDGSCYNYFLPTFYLLLLKHGGRHLGMSKVREMPSHVEQVMGDALCGLLHSEAGQASESTRS